jgi:acetyl-CoA acetyltransferase
MRRAAISRERSQPEHRSGRISGMIEAAENLAERYGITREQADEFAARSQQRRSAPARATAGSQPAHGLADPHHDAPRARRRTGRVALETMCSGGGQGMAALFSAT